MPALLHHLRSIVVEKGLNHKPATGNCELMTDLAPTNDGSMCAAGMLYAMEKDEPVCCTVTIQPIEFAHFAEQAGAVFFYAILHTFALIFVWAENVSLDGEEVNDDDDKDDSLHATKTRKKDTATKKPNDGNLSDSESDVDN